MYVQLKVQNGGQGTETTKVSFGRWLGKEDGARIYTHI